MLKAAAHHALGHFYHHVMRKNTRAVAHYVLAAELGRAGAQCALGALYHEGLGVTRDYRQAAHWYAEAAGRGDPQAQVNLGLMYVDGRGVGRNEATGLAWVYLAAAQQHEEARREMEALEGRLSKETVLKAQEQARRLQQKMGAGSL